MNAKNLLKKVIAIIMLSVVVTSAIAVVPASAAYSYYDDYEFSTGMLWWKENYTAKVYRDAGWFRVYYGNASVSTGFEYKNNTKTCVNIPNREVFTG